MLARQGTAHNRPARHPVEDMDSQQQLKSNGNRRAGSRHTVCRAAAALSRLSMLSSSLTSMPSAFDALRPGLSCDGCLLKSCKPFKTAST